jgi:hypothetical protein
MTFKPVRPMRPIDRYVRERQLELAHSIQHRKKIYLDLRFWIYAREAVADENAEPAKRKLLHLLRRGVEQGQFVCPISESTFLEVMKQANTTTRRIATAQIVDELSLGVSFTTGRTRIGTEIGHFLCTGAGSRDLYAMQELVWTKLAYAMGYMHPSAPELGDQLELTAQKFVFDELWQASLTHMVTTIGDAWKPDADGWNQSAARLNEEMKRPEHATPSYEQTYRDEIVGAADICQDLAADAMAGMAERAGVSPPEKGSEAWEESGRMCRNLIIAAFEQNAATKSMLRTMHVLASLHAGMRWEKTAKFTANHYYDFEHAAGALAYCDAFFTEGFLSNLSNAKHTALVSLNPCATTADIEEAINILRRFFVGRRA